MINEQEINAQAVLIREAYNTRRAIPPIRVAIPDATIEDAYRIQSANTVYWESTGQTSVGAKIGLTARAVQRQLGVTQPDYGRLFSSMAIQDGCTISSSRLLQPRIEAEVAFIMAKTPERSRLCTSEIISSVAYALPAIEIVDSRIDGWDIGIVDTIADNASSGLFVLGTQQTFLSKLDLRLCGMVMELNGDPVSFGAGAACLGNPLHALGWLANKMAEVGRPLQEGDVVLSGALGPMVDVRGKAHVEARINGLGSVRVQFGE